MPFLVDRLGVGAEAAPADIDDMGVQAKKATSSPLRNEGDTM